MKKILLLTLCILSFWVTGCGQKDKTLDNGNQTQAVEQGSESESNLTELSAQEKNGKVNLTLPKEVFGGNAQELAPKIKEAKGFEAVLVNKDGSATFTMTKDQHKKWLLEYGEEIKEEMQSVVIRNNFDSITEISYSKDYTSAKVKVDKKLFEKKPNDKMVSETIANKLKMYNYFAGKKPGKVKVSVTFVDEKTDKVIEKLEY